MPREIVEACTIGGRVELLPAAGITYRAFVNPSGGSADRMTLAIAHHQGEVRARSGCLDAGPRGAARRSAPNLSRPVTVSRR